MDITVKRALKLGWDEVVSIVTLELKKVLGIQLQCKISLTEDEYWDVEFIDYRMPLPKLCQVLQAVEAAPDDWETVLPDEGAVDVRDLGMCAAEKLIGKHLHLSWEHRIIDEDGLWLVGVMSDQQLPIHVSEKNCEKCNAFSLQITANIV